MMEARTRLSVCRLGTVVGLLLATAVYAGEAPDVLELVGLQGDVSEQELDSTRGRQDIFNAQISEIIENAYLSHTSANGARTGDNLISGDALSGLAGFSTVIQNTGNNVIIQDSLILNVSVRQ